MPSPVTAETVRPSNSWTGSPASARSASGADREPGTVEQVGLVVAELAQQDALLLLRRRLAHRRAVEQQQQHPRPLDVAEELVAQAATFGRALDQARDVGHDHLERRARAVGRSISVESNHAEVGLERREGIVGDLGLGRGDPRLISVDLPTLGNPTSATSAMSLSSRRIHRSSPISPCSAKPGARRLLDRKRALPLPP